LYALLVKRGSSSVNGETSSMNISIKRASRRRAQAKNNEIPVGMPFLNDNG
jgi:hypothetical protein